MALKPSQRFTDVALASVIVKKVTKTCFVPESDVPGAALLRKNVTITYSRKSPEAKIRRRQITTYSKLRRRSTVQESVPIASINNFDEVADQSLARFINPVPAPESIRAPPTLGQPYLELQLPKFSATLAAYNRLEELERPYRILPQQNSNLARRSSEEDADLILWAVGIFGFVALEAVIWSTVSDPSKSFFVTGLEFIGANVVLAMAAAWMVGPAFVSDTVKTPNPEAEEELRKIINRQLWQSSNDLQNRNRP